ncbi:MAG: hypothetical protein KJO55_07140 [Gammaproteobacteria bacterium]|nr:hypothetical protein [Gammaproteobacteria bacterium]
MKSIGGLLALIGAGSFGLHLIGREFTLISWIDNWGAAAGNGIRIALIVVGVALWFAGAKQEAAAAQETGRTRTDNQPD